MEGCANPLSCHTQVSFHSWTHTEIGYLGKPRSLPHGLFDPTYLEMLNTEHNA